MMSDDGVGVSEPVNSQDVASQDNDYLNMSPSYIAQKNQSEIIKLLKTTDYVVEFENSLKGLSYDYNNSQYLQVHVPLITNDGVNHIMPFIKSYCTNMVTMSIFDRPKIGLLKFRAEVALLDFLYLFNEKYCIKPENFNIIKELFMILIDSCLNRAREGALSDKSFLQTTERRVETFSNNAGGNFGGGGYAHPRRWGGGIMNFIRGQ